MWSKAGEANGGSIVPGLQDHTMNVTLETDGKPEKDRKQKRTVTSFAFLNQVYIKHTTHEEKHTHPGTHRGVSLGHHQSGQLEQDTSLRTPRLDSELRIPGDRSLARPLLQSAAFPPGAHVAFLHVCAEGEFPLSLLTRTAVLRMRAQCFSPHLDFISSGKTLTSKCSRPGCPCFGM